MLAVEYGLGLPKSLVYARPVLRSGFNTLLLGGAAIRRWPR